MSNVLPLSDYTGIEFEAVTVEEVEEAKAEFETLRQNALNKFAHFVFLASKRDKTLETDFYPLIMFYCVFGELSPTNVTIGIKATMISNIILFIKAAEMDEELEQLTRLLDAWHKFATD